MSSWDTIKKFIMPPLLPGEGGYEMQMQTDREQREQEQMQALLNQKMANRRIWRMRLYVMTVLLVLVVTSVFMFHAAATSKTEKRNRIIFTIAGSSLVVASVAIFVMYLQIVEKQNVLHVISNLVNSKDDVNAAALESQKKALAAAAATQEPTETGSKTVTTFDITHPLVKQMQKSPQPIQPAAQKPIPKRKPPPAAGVDIFGADQVPNISSVPAVNRTPRTPPKLPDKSTKTVNVVKRLLGS